MKFKIVVCNEGDSDHHNRWWEEICIKDIDDPIEYAEQIIKNFNDTLHAHEKRRELIAVEVINDNEMPHDHDWWKTNIMTLYDSRTRTSYDAMRCKRCGVTGKRYGLGGVSIDSKYRASWYLDCAEVLKRKKHG